MIKKRGISGILFSLMFLFAVLPAFADEGGMSLIADNLEEGTYTGGLESGEFLIRSTEEKKVVVDGNSKTAEDGTTFSRRIKLGGSGKAEYRSIHFSVSGNAEIRVYAMSSSSSSDRQLDLYGLDGILVESMAAPGSGLNMKTFAIGGGDYYLASPKSGVNVYGVIISEKQAVIHTLGISGLTREKFSASREEGIFTIAATENKTVTIDGNNKTAEDGTSYTQRLKLGGAGKADYRSIHFTASGKAELTVYAMSSSSSSDRQLDLYGLDGTLVDSMAAPGGGLNFKTFSLEGGDYYLASPSSGVNVYEVILSAGAAAEVVRGGWDDAAAPFITGVTAEGGSINLTFSLLTDRDNADKAIVYMKDNKGNVLEENLVGKSADAEKSALFAPSSSGVYTFEVIGFRNGIDEGKASGPVSLAFSLPLQQPVLRAFNNEDGSVTVKWTAVREARKYAVDVEREGAFSEVLTSEGLEGRITGLTAGQSYNLRVRAVRGADEKASEAVTKLVENQQEREWSFTYFGQSTNKGRNSFEMIDPEDLSFRLNSCTVKDNGSIDGKGGKFTTYHDGVSFYYTVVDPDEENFELRATFEIEYINPTADGQEGFGLLVMDSLGDYGVSSVNHYTNSAGLIATKFEGYVDGIKRTSKDTLGARFVTGITGDVLARGDSGIAQNGSSVSTGFSYDRDDLVKTGDSYTLTLKKTNTGYHLLLDGYEEKILYGVDKLLQLDPDNLYAGFAVARGCNVKVTDVSFTTTDPADDPEAVPEPAQLVSYRSFVDSPLRTSEESYDFVYVADVPGSLDLADERGDRIISRASVAAGRDFVRSLVLKPGRNSYTVTFTPREGYAPGENRLLESYEPVGTALVVEFRTYRGDILHVSPEGTAAGDGTKRRPLDLDTAVSFAGPGQTVELAGGTYMMEAGLVIPRGNDGTAAKYKTLRSAEGERAVLDFSRAGGGMQLRGDYWKVENLDITKTPGDVKGLQIAGHRNIISGVHAYGNGDTGIQISGASRESFDKWPSHNLVVGCLSHDNIDPGQNNADGFAAKLTVGEGNVFDNCIAHHNLDDGWDLFAKIESGPIGNVTIRNSVAYANGTLSDGTGRGDGNGFKLGGDGIAVAHVLSHSIAYDNNNDGITSNSNPAVIVQNCTSYGNGGENLVLYGKGSDSRSFVLENLISLAGKEPDDVSEMPSLIRDDNFFSAGDRGVNRSGAVLDSSIFQSVDTSRKPEIGNDLNVDMKGLFAIKEGAAEGLGARLEGSTAKERRTYTVREGDYLTKIASEQYGKGGEWTRIYEENRGKISNPHLIYRGQILILP